MGQDWLLIAKDYKCDIGIQTQILTLVHEKLEAYISFMALQQQ